MFIKIFCPTDYGSIKLSLRQVRPGSEPKLDPKSKDVRGNEVVTSTGDVPLNATNIP